MCAVYITNAGKNSRRRQSVGKNLNNNTKQAGNQVGKQVSKSAESSSFYSAREYIDRIKCKEIRPDKE